MHLSLYPPIFLIFPPQSSSFKRNGEYKAEASCVSCRVEPFAIIFILLPLLIASSQFTKPEERQNIIHSTFSSHLALLENKNKEKMRNTLNIWAHAHQFQTFPLSFFPMFNISYLGRLVWLMRMKKSISVYAVCTMHTIKSCVCSVLVFKCFVQSNVE